MIIYVIVSLFETQSIDFSNSYTTFIPTFFPVSSGHLRRGYKIISCRRIARIQVVFIVEDTLSRHLLARNHNYSDARRYFFLPTHISRWPLWKDRTRLNKSRPTSILIFDRLENIFFFPNVRWNRGNEKVVSCSWCCLFVWFTRLLLWIYLVSCNSFTFLPDFNIEDRINLLEWRRIYAAA